MKFDYACDIFLDHVIVFKSNGTYKFYKSHLTLLKKLFLNYDLNDFNYNVLMSFIISQKKSNVSNNTINKRVLCINQVLKFNNYLPITIEKLKVVEKNFDYLNYIQVCKLIDYINSSNLSLESKLLIRLFLDTGCRLNEVLNIHVDNINLDLNCILLNFTKTDSERYVFFTDDLKYNYLIPYLKINNNNLLFTLSASGVSSLFYRVKNKLNFKKFSPHMLRHTYATILVNNNTNLEFIRKTLGHSSLSVTKKYLHSSQEELFKVYKNNFKI